MIEAGNLFAGLKQIAGTEEQFDALVTSASMRVERIVSKGQASPPGFWYDQEQAEWVVLLSGSAELQFADEPLPRLLNPGDFVDIAPHRRHRVNWTDPDQATVWLAVHYPVEDI